MPYSMEKTGIREAQNGIRKISRVDLTKHSLEAVVECLYALAARTRPYVPEDTSALINSEYIDITEGTEGVSAILSYGENSSAVGRSGTPVREYSVYVHEGPQRNWGKPGASNKFLEKGLVDFLRKDYSRIIQEYSV